MFRRSVSIFCHLSDCVCFIAYAICTILLVLNIARFLTFESLRLPSTCSGFESQIIVLSLLRWLKDIYNGTLIQLLNWIYSTPFTEYLLRMGYSRLSKSRAPFDYLRYSFVSSYFIVLLSDVCFDYILLSALQLLASNFAQNTCRFSTWTEIAHCCNSTISSSILWRHSCSS